MALSSSPAPIRAAIYCRISKDDAGDQLGVRRQERDCRALAERRGWEIVDVFVDDDVSAYVPGRRPSYARLLEAVKGGWIDAVLMYDLDRLHRHPWELEEFFRTCDSAALTLLASVAGDVDLGTNDGRLVARIMGAVAKKASDDTSRRLKRKHDEKASNGERHGARPFGYEADGVTIRESEASLIRRAAAAVLTGESLNAVARQWDADAVPTPQGARSWSGKSVRTILTGPHQAGLRRHRGDVVGAGAWPAILDRATHERLIAHLDRRERSVNPPRRQPFTGIIRCGSCDSSLTRDQVRSRKPRADESLPRPVWATYRCHKSPGRTNCGRLSVAADPLEAIITEAVFQRLDGPGLAEAVASLADCAQPDDTGAEIAACEAQRSELAEMWAAGDITRGEWLSARRPLEARLDAARRRLARQAGTEVLSPYIAGGGLLRLAWPDLSPDQRRAVLAAVIDRVMVEPATRRGRIFDPDRIDIVWRV